ncbi:MAG: hypothetical protein AVDCRST_MAG20-674, partial [uncultured Acidimicrobiales bacterium]
GLARHLRGVEPGNRCSGLRRRRWPEKESRQVVGRTPL